jgi:hypothetical protein
VRMATRIRGSSDAPPVDEEQLRAARREQARRNAYWQELEEAALVRRAPFLVDADTDELWAPFLAPVFETGSARIVANDQVPLAYFVTPEGDVRFVERVGGTWSAIVARRARRERS